MRGQKSVRRKEYGVRRVWEDLETVRLGELERLKTEVGRQKSVRRKEYGVRRAGVGNWKTEIRFRRTRVISTIDDLL